MGSPPPSRQGQGLATHTSHKARIDTGKGVKSPSSQHDSCPTSSCQCNFFLWDIVSAYKYQDTVFQAQRNTFEGKGGKKFVRIQPNTVLEKWYPQLREGIIKPDRCFVCGYSWKDHLEYWWYCRGRKGGDSAFDSYMKNNSSKGGGKTHAFHKRYVEEVDSSSRRYRRKGQEIRKSMDGEVSFLVQPFDPLADGRPKSLLSMLLLALTRASCLLKIEDLIWLTSVESLKSEQQL